ncbi:MAG: complement resistance protein TraT [Pseudomonadota bacterium]
MRPLFLTLLIFVLASCAQQSRYGMVIDPETGLQFGSAVEKNIVTDASFHNNKKIKVRVRNTSGDLAFDLGGFKNEIEQAYISNGYEATEGDDFGLLVDVNVRYSGQIQQNLSQEYSYISGLAGGLAGATESRQVALAGSIAGAALGNILGSHQTDDTYIIITDVTFGIIANAGDSQSGRRVTFGNNTRSQSTGHVSRGFRDQLSTGVSVYAGGRNAPQSAIAGHVRARLAHIIMNII